MTRLQESFVSSFRHCFRRASAAVALSWVCMALVHPASARTSSPGHPPVASATTGMGVPAWARATPAGIKVGAAYFTVVNRSGKGDVLLAIESPMAARAEVHRTLHQDGLSRMRLAGDIPIAAGQMLRAAPGGLHVMLTDLKQPLVAGQKIPLTLHFRGAGAMQVQAEVRTAAAGMEHDHARR